MSSPERKKYPLYSKLILAGISIFICLLAIEVWSRLSPTRAQPRGLYQYHPVLNYGAKPNVSGRTFGVPFQTNSKGFRDKERSYEKGRDTFRILCLGDSFVWGIGVSFEETVPKLLQGRLERRFPKRKIEVLNLGALGSNAAYHANLLEAEGIRYHPDLVVLFQNHTDSMIEKSLISPEAGWLYRARFFIRRFEVYHFFAAGTYRLLRIIRGDWEGTILDRREDIAPRYIDDFQGWIETKEAFKQIRSLADRHRFRVLFVIHPKLDTLEAYPFEFYHLKLKEAWEEEPYVLDLLEVFRGEKTKELWVRPFDSHPNLKANRMTSERLERFLLRHRLIK